MPAERATARPTRRTKKKLVTKPPAAGLAAALRSAADRPGCDPRVREWLKKLLAGDTARAGVVSNEKPKNTPRTEEAP
ncbi:hypothetical protein J8F10_09375 [Gemmata sp. G18]|uniref:Uncharacterized protein n=1 Tax=Gemmata palustris TaxID=2822762 RepID=A0ABS5BP41_9BACT|nr:hypothetical protein [Gemmata palustris]MBP3955491.1 hypothetical protein [Gemmata palustris]